MYLTGDEWPDLAAWICRWPALTPFEAPDAGQVRVLSAAGRQGRSFAAERAEAGRNIYEAVIDHIRALQRGGKRVLLAAWTRRLA
jgi:transcription-repair coupling factor (superfamily II helicase)